MLCFFFITCFYSGFCLFRKNIFEVVVMQKNNNNVIIMLTRGLPQVKENMKDSLQKLNSVTASFLGGVFVGPYFCKAWSSMSLVFNPNFSFQWMRARWTSDPCYAFYGVDGSDCSFLIYLSEVEWFCPPLAWRNQTTTPTLKPPPKRQVI